jgi:hypothetical protein
MIVPLAHFGHVLVDLPIFFGPVFVLTLWIVFMGRRDSKQRSRER